ncbi:hypothetical protein [Acidovorax sp.]|uniref:hypothetical protein n=1 Tax=Acidovorax sp. TaxID=1872122 RepID=UPI00391FACAE
MKVSGTQTMGLGGALKSAIDAVLEEGAASLSVADAGTQTAFLDAWARTLTEHARYLRSKGENLSAPAVFVYDENCADVGEELGWTRRPMLGGTPNDPFAGTLAIGTGEIGAYAKPEYLSDTNVMTDAIRAAGLGNALTVALLSTSLLVIWAEGVDSDASPEIRRELDDAPVVLDLAALDKALDQFYERSARQSRTWWKDRETRITVESPEGVVQNDLLHFLLGKYSEVARVKVETVIGHGRADITLTPMKEKLISAVIELKVTRDFLTPRPGTLKPNPINLQSNIDWAKSGVSQTAAYRDDETLDAAYLCVYDFCAGNREEISKAVEEAAIPYNVIAKRYWVTASHVEHRKDRYPDPPTGPSTVKA